MIDRNAYKNNATLRTTAASLSYGIGFPPPPPWHFFTGHAGSGDKMQTAPCETRFKLKTISTHTLRGKPAVQPNLVTEEISMISTRTRYQDITLGDGSQGYVQREKHMENFLEIVSFSV